MYVEDLKRGTNKEVGPKDIFEMGSNYPLKGTLQQGRLIDDNGVNDHPHHGWFGYYR